MPELSSRLRIILAAVILIPILLYWGLGNTPQESTVKSNPMSAKMDYFVDKAKMREWAENGELKRELRSVRVEHNPIKQLNYLTTPQSTSYRGDGTQVSISAEYGSVLDNNSRTDLAGYVRVLDNPALKNGTVFTTEKLSIYPKQDFAETDQPVIITSSDSYIEGVGMDINFNTRALNLHSEVKGTHSHAK